MGTYDLSELGFDELISREWLASNGNGGYASSTLASVNTRKYHGLLVASLAPPVRRMVLLSRVEETVRAGGQSYELAANEYPGTVHPQGHRLLRAFDQHPFPRWAYQGDGWTLEKQLRVLQGENTVVLSYCLQGASSPVELEVRPLFALRGIHELMYQWNARLDSHTRASNKRHHRIPASSRTPEIFFAHDGAFSSQPCWYLNTIYRREQERGYAGLEDLWMPGAVRFRLTPGQTVHFVCSTEPIDFIRVLADAQRQHQVAVPAPVTPSDGTLEMLLRAAEQFVVRMNDEQWSIVSGYPWLAPHGRDALISLPGLLLVTGRVAEAEALLRHLAALARDGVMPSELAEDRSGYRYHGADVSLWFIHCVGEFLRYGGEEPVVRELLPVIQQIIECYRHGTSLCISTDADGLLRSAAPGIATTWMNAQIGEWIVTPRQGRPVELNALWHSALCIASELSLRFGQEGRAEALSKLAAAHKKAFNGRFWNESLNCCYDVVEDKGLDASIRPNQLLAMSLPHPVLDVSRHAALFETVTKELLTPLGLRTLSSRDVHYQGTYSGPPLARERAYHQGSIFPWLLGPYVRCMLRLRGRGEAVRQEVRSLLQGCLNYMLDPGMGQLCELFSGDRPHAPGGVPASACSVAQLLQCYVEDILDLTPGSGAGRPTLQHRWARDMPAMKTSANPA